jgi:hypothetical protein
VNSFNAQAHLAKKQPDQAIKNIILASECDEVGFGVSATRQGKRIGEGAAKQILTLYEKIPAYRQTGFIHFEEIQLFVDGISKDRVSDI